MRTISTGVHDAYDSVHPHHLHNLLVALENWVEAHEPTWDYYRLGIGATGIFLQVTIAGIMVAVLGMAGASPWIYGIGVFLAFMANSLVFAQLPIRQMIGTIVISIVVNLSLVLIYAIPMLIR